MSSVADRRSSEERGAEKHMDEYLQSLGLQRKKIAKDGSCLFRAVAEQVLHCQSLHTQVRSQCVEFLRKNRETYEAFIEGNFKEYLHKLKDPQQWVGEVEINALALMYKRDFWIFQEPGKPAVNITDKSFPERVLLCFLNGNHYDCVYPISYVKNTAMCQSILYELLYDKVCGVDQSLQTMCNRAPKSSDILIDDCLPLCISSDESDTEDTQRQGNRTCAAVVKSKGRGRGRFLSDRVRRSLNPTLLRNVQFDLWHKSKKAQQKMDFNIAAGMAFSVGDRCQVRIDACGEVVNATVKKLSPADNGLVTVYNNQMGEIEVPVWKLRPPSETSWSTVVRDKRVSNGHGEWEDRGKGRGRGKLSSAPAGAPQAAAPPAGRVLKQHSWPPQGADERETPSRKSESVSFGLTNEQRLAKEEEERNAALVELRFPDERSFPALKAGGQNEGGKKTGGEKKRSQKNTRKSPVEEVSASPPCGRNGSTPPLSSFLTSVPAHPSVSKPLTSASPPVCAAPKLSATSHASANAPLCPSPPVSGVVPSTASHLSFMTPVLPAASGSHGAPAAAPSAVSSSISTPSSFPKASSPPTFIAPIAPSPAAAQSLMGRTTPSPGPVITLKPAPVTEAPGQTASANKGHDFTASAPSSEDSKLHVTPSDLLTQCQVPNQDQVHALARFLTQTPPALIQTQTPPAPIQTQTPPAPIQTQTPPAPIQTLTAPAPIQTQTLPALIQTHTAPAPIQTQTLPALIQTQTAPTPIQTQTAPAPIQTQTAPAPIQTQIASAPIQTHTAPAPIQTHTAPAPIQTQGLPQTGPVHFPQPPLPSQVPFPSSALQTSAPSAPGSESSGPASLPDKAPTPPLMDHPSADRPAPPFPGQGPLPPQQLHYPPLGPQPLPLEQQLSLLCQDPLYPGFPLGDNGQVIPLPPISIAQSGDDLPQDMNVLRFFYNLGVKAYSLPIHPPLMYLYPLRQAYSLQPRVPSRSPSPLYPQPPPASVPIPQQQDTYPPRPSPPPASSLYDQRPPQPPPPSSFNPAHYAPPVTHNHTHNTQAPPTAYNPGHGNQEAPPPSYNNSCTPQFDQRSPQPLPQSSYSPPRLSQPSPMDLPHPQDTPYPQHMQWQTPQANPSYPPAGYQYNQGFYHHQPQPQGPTDTPQPNGDTALRLRARPPAALEAAALANTANMNGGQMPMLPAAFGHSSPDVGENMMLLVDPPLNKPIVINVPKSSSGQSSPLYSPANSHSSDSSNMAPFFMTHLKPSSYRYANPNPPAAFVPAHAAGFLQPELMSVSVGTEEAWEESEEANASYRVHRRASGSGYRGRGRGQYRPRGYSNQGYNNYRGRGRY